MLPPFIIDEIRRREQEQHRRQQQDQPRVDLPIPRMPPQAPSPRREDEDRGVIIIDL